MIDLLSTELFFLLQEVHILVHWPLALVRTHANKQERNLPGQKNEARGCTDQATKLMEGHNKNDDQLYINLIMFTVNRVIEER